MKTINLRINWFVYSIQILLTALFYILFSSLGVSQVANLIVGASTLFIVTSLLLIQMKKRYVHIDRAGFSYKYLSKTHYLHHDEIAAIKVTKLLGANILSVELKSKKKVMFLFWSVDIEDIQKAAKLFDCELIGEVPSQVKA
ncbi:hypothetical protein N474_16085 [Pseudoalteromonas luteoviolacea CPMOR-2]|uniref:DUF304 domain-containing protein n=1 Tax=Pseudoalteromonas luteoviolacea DSM 6061 TaxID=1365250 RepID=A0A162A0F4_9GAMM|nr:hypothetical protein [Pseudoalteromonas luteoviolacea]KZN40661.1 hypothetical protein N475_11065 [Pseudoalteromonas luteoviolacea DSM 6061]KZN55223.1 hypothetical protein N474_16085 [Pseudoalteromonas luteoviolacea CPMOR-2]MBE0387718.1 hypothetical protein [Pseudoalteromonas luteoviolacea DSM 6061]